MFKKNSHCSYCGCAFSEDAPWPRQCRQCGQESFLNPLPVAVLLVPVDDGLLTVRRAIAPHVGRLALPGGYIDYGEAWQAAGAREVFEESGLVIAPEEVREFRVRSAPDGTLLVFGLARARRAIDLPPFAPTRESSERVILAHVEELAFPLHTAVVEDYFAQRRNEGSG